MGYGTPEEFKRFAETASPRIRCRIVEGRVAVHMAGVCLAVFEQEPTTDGGHVWMSENRYSTGNCSLTQILGRFAHGSAYHSWFRAWHAAGMPDDGVSVTVHAPSDPGVLHKDARGSA